MKVTQPERQADPYERRRGLHERLRAEFIAGAEQEWRRQTGRPMTVEEFERVLRRYPGTCDLPTAAHSKQIAASRVVSDAGHLMSRLPPEGLSE